MGREKDQRVPPGVGAGQERAGDPVIRTSGLTKAFGNQVAVESLTFEVRKGLIFGLIGPSGCGKTTTVRLLTGVYAGTRGEAVVLGESPKRFRRHTRRRIGYMPQYSTLYPDLTVWQNLRFAGSVYGVSPFQREHMEEVLRFVELDEHKRKRASDLSGGMQRRLDLAAILLHEPDLLFLDEPTGGVDPVLRRKFWDHFQALRDEGRTLFVTTQYVGEAAYCDQVAVMAAGRLLTIDTPEGLRHQAYGGDVVDLVPDRRLDGSTLEELKRLSPVFSVERSGELGLRFVVQDAGTAIPALMQYCQDHGISTHSIDESLPPFDDVFVHLVEAKQEEAGYG
jgi:ABC-2 type transport system ATP-binding protein